MNIGRNTAHLIMNGGYHWNRFFGDIHVSEVHADLIDRWQTFHDGLSTDVGQIQHNVVAVRTTTATLFNLLIH